jgi:toxin ParE1/3/4
MRRLDYSQRAQADLTAIVDYVAEITGDDGAAYNAVQKLDAQCKKLAALPGVLGHPRDDLGEGLRTFPFGSYAIVFRYGSGDTLEVARIVSAKRDMRALFRKTSGR